MADQAQQLPEIDIAPTLSENEHAVIPKKKARKGKATTSHRVLSTQHRPIRAVWESVGPVRPGGPGGRYKGAPSRKNNQIIKKMPSDVSKDNATNEKGRLLAENQALR